MGILKQIDLRPVQRVREMIYLCIHNIHSERLIKILDFSSSDYNAWHNTGIIPAREEHNLRQSQKPAPPVNQWKWLSYNQTVRKGYWEGRL